MKTKEDMSELEKLSEQIYNVYQLEAKRQGDIRHKDKYEDLPENVKEFDRVLARFFTELLEQQKKEVTEVFKKYSLVYDYERKIIRTDIPIKDIEEIENFLNFYLIKIKPMSKEKQKKFSDYPTEGFFDSVSSDIREQLKIMIWSVNDDYCKSKNMSRKEIFEYFLKGIEKEIERSRKDEHDSITQSFRGMERALREWLLNYPEDVFISGNSLVGKDIGVKFIIKIREALKVLDSKDIN